MATSVSNIAKALARNTDAICIPKPRAVLGSHAGNVFAVNAPADTGLPTPPNSISPGLPAHGLKARSQHETLGYPLEQIDSDIDLQDADDHASNHVGLHPVKSNFPGSHEEHGHITPAFLAKYHLPEMMIDKGPLAIRHLMNELARTLPGFAEIPPAKARRIVVGGLENRSGGGPTGDIEFEKVGWGRWDARIRSHGARDQTMKVIQENRLPRFVASGVPRHSSAALGIPTSNGSRRKTRRVSHGSWTADSSHFDQGDRMATDVAEHDADMMSIDGEPDQTSRYFGAPVEGRAMDMDSASDTDEEDWAAIGAEALRGKSPFASFSAPRLSQLRRRSRTKSPFGALRSVTQTHYDIVTNRQNQLDFSGFEGDSQEREAIEALLRMGSM